jgi:hypothetical protein
MKPKVTKKPLKANTPGRKALRQAYKQAAQVYGDTQRFGRIRRRILGGELYKVIAADEKVTISYISLVRSRAGIARRVTPRPC